MDRDGLGAWVSSLGDHPHAPAFRDLLAHFDEQASRAEAAMASAGFHLEARIAAEAKHAVVLADANRLARWIIEHPCGADPSEVLNLHDRAVQ